MSLAVQATNDFDHLGPLYTPKPKSFLDTGQG